MSSRRHGVNVTAAAPTGTHRGAKVASVVSFPAETGLRRDCGDLSTPTPTLSGPPLATAGEANRGSLDRKTRTGDLSGGAPDAA